MASLSIKLDDETYDRLQDLAVRHGVLMEEEVLQILKRAVSPPERLGDLFLNVFGLAGGVELELLPLESHEPVDLGTHPVDQVFGRLHLESPVDTLLDEMRGPRSGFSGRKK